MNNHPGQTKAIELGYTLTSYSPRSANYNKGHLTLTVKVYRETEPPELHAEISTYAKGGMVQITTGFFSFPHPKFCLFEGWIAEAGAATRRALGEPE